MRTPIGVVACVLALSARGESLAVVAGDRCPAGTNFETAGYTVRSARAFSPFSFLPWVSTGLGTVDASLAAMSGRPYRRSEVDAAKDALDRVNFAGDDGEQRIKISLIVVSVTHCTEDKQLDLEFLALTSRIAPVLSGTIESHRAEKSAPERVAGADAAPGRLRVAPSAGFDRSEHLFGGARVEVLRPKADAASGLVNALVAEGRASSTMHDFSLSAGGSSDMTGAWLAHADWQLDYLNASAPTDGSRLRQGRLAARLSAITKRLGAWELPVRFGAMVEGGRRASDFQGTALPPDSVAGAGYGSIKLYVGTTTTLKQNVLSASYGVEVGSVGPAARVDWVKHVVDLGHELSLHVGDHRQLTIESRLTAGLLQVPGTAPVGTRFFGGNREEAFVPGDTWQIRANPVIRSIGANLFERSVEGPGGRRFIAYNMTAAVPIWRKPLVPTELSSDPDFHPLVDAQINSATSFFGAGYLAADPHFKTLLGKLGEVKSSLAGLGAAVGQAQAAHPGQFADLFKKCVQTIATAKRKADDASEATDAAQVDEVGTLLPVDKDRLGQAATACGEALNAELADNDVTTAVSRVQAVRTFMDNEFMLIDQAGAIRKAEADMGYSRRTINTFIDDINLVSVSPVLMFDVAHLGPASGRLGTRYGIGGGLRVTIVNSVDFTFGYLANPRRLPQESPGAYFLSVQFKDVFL